MILRSAIQGERVERATCEGRTFRALLGPKGEPVDIQSPTAAELDELDQITRGARLVRRTGPCSYVVLR